jgi:hypothetical protein
MLSNLIARYRRWRLEGFARIIADPVCRARIAQMWADNEALFTTTPKARDPLWPGYPGNASSGEPQWAAPPDHVADRTRDRQIIGNTVILDGQSPRGIQIGERTRPRETP